MNEIAKDGEYQVILVRTDLAGYEDFFVKIKPSFDIAKGAYATELSLITGKPEDLYKIKSTNDPETYCLAVDRENNVLGFVLLEADARTMTLWTCHVYVRPEVRQKGVYKTMLKRIKKFARDAKMVRLFSVVHIRNTPSLLAHKKSGFKRQWVGFEMDMENADEKN